MRRRTRFDLAMTRFCFLAVVCITSLAASVSAQANETEHTYKSNPNGVMPKASIEDIRWLQGSWEGPAFGGISEELWSEPRGHAMMGVYRSVENELVAFYEVMSLVEVNGSLELRLKHFHTDLTGWEEKDKVFKFPLVKIVNGQICFDGMTYKREGRDSVSVYLAIRGKDGKSTETVFRYRRKVV